MLFSCGYASFHATFVYWNTLGYHESNKDYRLSSKCKHIKTKEYGYLKKWNYCHNGVSSTIRDMFGALYLFILWKLAVRNSGYTSFLPTNIILPWTFQLMVHYKHINFINVFNAKKGRKPWIYSIPQWQLLIQAHLVSKTFFVVNSIPQLKCYQRSAKS